VTRSSWRSLTYNTCSRVLTMPRRQSALGTDRHRDAGGVFSRVPMGTRRWSPWGCWAECEPWYNTSRRSSTRPFGWAFTPSRRAVAADAAADVPSAALAALRSVRVAPLATSIARMAWLYVSATKSVAAPLPLSLVEGRPTVTVENLCSAHSATPSEGTGHWALTTDHRPWVCWALGTGQWSPCGCWALYEPWAWGC
jgi:hypothetical protein